MLMTETNSPDRLHDNLFGEYFRYTVETNTNQVGKQIMSNKNLTTFVKSIIKL